MHLTDTPPVSAKEPRGLPELTPPTSARDQGFPVLLDSYRQSPQIDTPSHQEYVEFLKRT